MKKGVVKVANDGIVTSLELPMMMLSPFKSLK